MKCCREHLAVSSAEALKNFLPSFKIKPVTYRTSALQSFALPKYVVSIRIK